METNQLDSITKHLIDINQQLALIKKDTASGDTTRTLIIIFSAASPILVGFLVFLLNRNKEFRLERAKLAGLIHLSLVDFKTAFSHYLRKNIYFNSNDRIYKIISEEDYQYTLSEEEKELYNPQSYVELRNYFLKEMNQQKENLYQSKRELTKLFGRYKFYLDRLNRKRFSETTESFMNLKLPDYEFTHVDDDKNVISETKKIINELPQFMKKNYKPIFEKIEIFLDASIEFYDLD